MGEKCAGENTFLEKIGMLSTYGNTVIRPKFIQN